MALTSPHQQAGYSIMFPMGDPASLGALTLSDSTLLGIPATTPLTATGDLQLLRVPWPYEYAVDDANQFLSWKLTEGTGNTATDSSGNSRDGTIEADELWVSKDGTSMLAPGANGAITLASQTFGAATDMTVDVVVYVTTPELQTTGAICSFGGTATSGYFFLGFTSNRRLFVQIRDISFFSSTDAFTEGYNHIRLTWTTGASKNIELYLNGTRLVTNTGTTNWDGSITDTVYGGRYAGSLPIQGAYMTALSISTTRRSTGASHTPINLFSTSTQTATLPAINISDLASDTSSVIDDITVLCQGSGGTSTASYKVDSGSYVSLGSLASGINAFTGLSLAPTTSITLRANMTASATTSPGLRVSSMNTHFRALKLLAAPSLSAATTVQGSGASIDYTQSSSTDANQLVYKFAAEPSVTWSTQTASGIATGVSGSTSLTSLNNDTMYRVVAYAQGNQGNISPPSNPIRVFVSDGSSIGLKIAKSIASVASGLANTVVFKSEVGEEINQFKPNLQQGPYCLVKTPMEIESNAVGAGWREVLYDVPVEVHYDDRTRIHANTAQTIATTFQNTFDHLPDALAVSDSRLISLDSLRVSMEAASSRRAPSLDAGVVGMRMRVGVHEKKTVT